MKYLRLVLGVTPEHIGAAGLEIPGRNQDHVTIFDPRSSLHLSSYPADSVGSILTLHHYSIVTKHLGDNPKQLPRFGENELIDVPFRENSFLSQTTLPSCRLSTQLSILTCLTRDLALKGMSEL